MVRNERNRYILFRLIKKKKDLFEPQEILKSIWKSIWRYFGMKEANKVGLWLIEFDQNEGYGLLRCSHHTKEFIITALTLITEVSGKKVILSPINTSGTIRSMKKFQSSYLNS